MPRRMRLKVLGALAPAGVLAATLAAVALPTSSVAATGNQLYQADLPLDCILAPGTLNNEGTVQLHVQGDAPATLGQNDVTNLTNVTTSLTTPAGWSAAFGGLGAVTTSGVVTAFNIAANSNLTPAVTNGASFIAGGLPFGPTTIPYNTTTGVGSPLVLTIPSTGPFTVGPFTVVGAPGGNAVLSVDSTPGWTSTNGHAPFKATGNGIVALATGYDGSGNTAVGPVPVVCTAPTPAVVLGTIPITTVDTPPSSTTTTTTVTTDTTTPDLIVHFPNWKLTGSVTDKKLNQAIPLPTGATFNGSADLNTGVIGGDIKVPPFSATVKVLGLPTKVGLTITETGPASGTILPDPVTAGNLVISIAAKANLGVTSVGLFGLNIPTSCTTTSPLVLPLSASVGLSGLGSGVSFTGTTTFPSLKCGGLLGGILGPVLSALMSGPNNPFALKIAP